MIQIPRIGPASIPAVGFGTWQVEGELAAEMTAAALDAGYRHIDTAQVYGNEAEVGRGVANSAVPRPEIFLTTKIFPEHHAPDVLTRKAHESLERLDTPYVDLLLLHWPSREVPFENTIAALVELRESGVARHVGVSNFTIDQLETVTSIDSEIVANQIEFHPFLDQSAMLAAAAKRNVTIEAYSPLARGKVLDNPVLQKIAEAHGQSPAHIALAWLLSHDNVVVLPKTSTRDRLAGNLAAAGITLSQEEIAEISQLGSRDGRLIDPDGLAPEWD